jgi:cell division cycle 2-like
MSAPKSRWAADDPEEAAAIAQRKREKEEKKRAKAEKQRQLEVKQQQQSKATDNATEDRPTKRRRLSNDDDDDAAAAPTEKEVERKLLRLPASEWAPCRHVDNYERLNHIEEGSYGLVSRAKDLATGEVVALKKLKIDNAPDGFPVTGLREIQTLQRARHQNVVHLREIVMGNSMNE